VRLWDVDDSAERRELAAIPVSDGVRRLAFSPDGGLLAVGLDGSGMILLDVATRAPLVTVSYADYNSNCVRGIAFTPDGLMLAMASLDGEVRLWKVENLMDGTQGRALRILRGHEGGVTSVTFSANGMLMATTSHDGTARLWAIKKSKA
jgi:WD40 repeat protein